MREHDGPPAMAPQPWVPPGWLRILVVLTALVLAVIETVFLGARLQSYAFILAVLFGTEGVAAIAKTKGMLG